MYNLKPLSIVTSGAAGFTAKWQSGEKTRNFVDEYNKHMSAISAILVRTQEEESEQRALDDNSVKEFIPLLQRLLSNEYFHLMYINNMIVKELILRSIELLIEATKEPNLKMNLLDQLTNMLEWEINLEKVEFRCESIADRYRLLFEKLLKPCIELMRSYAVANSFYSPGLHSSPDASSLLMAANASSSLSINEAAKQSRRAIRPLVKVISYMLVCVPFQRMFCDYSLAEFLNLTTLSVSSARLSAQLMLCLTVNICHYGEGLGEKTKDQSLLEMCRNENEKIEVFMQATERAIQLFESHVRQPTCRDMIKRALNIYCECITRHIDSGAANNSSVDDSGLDSEMTTTTTSSEANDESDTFAESMWPNCLYRVVISIVRILRLDFENQNNPVDIELVIYFYELLRDNMDSLTTEDAFNIAVKLMDIIVKINEWAETSRSNFNSSQYTLLKSLSFELANLFLSTLKTEYAKNYWDKLEGFWIDGIHNWEPTAYQTISTYCRYNRESTYFNYTRILTRAIFESWKVNFNGSNLDDQLKCVLKPKKSSKSFFKSEMLDAIVDLAILYDEIISQDKSAVAYFDDLVPLFQIVLHLFRSVNVHNKLALIVNVYNRIFSGVISSVEIKKAGLWTSHLDLIVEKLYEIEESCLSLDDTLTRSSLELIEFLYSFFGTQAMKDYDYVIKKVYLYLKTSNR